jgi:hypothetical protein
MNQRPSGFLRPETDKIILDLVSILGISEYTYGKVGEWRPAIPSSKSTSSPVSLNLALYTNYPGMDSELSRKPRSAHMERTPLL